MALFEFEDGHLVPAQFGYPVSHDLGPELVDAICQQVLQIVSRPLFPVTWRDMTGQVGEETPRLTALDVTGQIVSVEILKLLDSETLITSLSRLAVVASLSWSDLAAEYPSGPEGFRAGWAQFRDSMPPAVGPGPRLIMVAGEIDPAVRPALSILATSGVEVHLMNLRQMSNGRLFLDVNAVGPRLYGHAPQLLGSSAAAPAITAGSVPAEPEASAESAEFESTIDASEQDEAPAIPAPPAPLSADTDEEDAVEPETPTTRPTPKVAPHLRDVFRYSVDEEPPAPWKSEDDGQDQAQDAAEEQLDEAGADREDQAEESAEAELEDERDADADKAPSDELVDQESDDTEGVDADSDDAESANEAERPEDESADWAEDHEAEAERPEDESADEAEASEHSDEQGQDGDAYVAEDHEDSEGEDSGDDLGGFEHDHPEELDNEEADVDGEQRWERPAHLGSRASRRSHSEAVELNDGGATEAATASFVDREEESPEVVAAREEGVPVLGRDEDGLRTLAQILGEDTPLVARGELGLPNDLVLAASGAISGAGLTYPSLDTMLTARGMSHIDVWSLVRIGDRLGPTLAEALDEVNREIVREYANAPRERRIARH